LTPSHLQKRLSRSLVVLWREQPTRYDIEALQDNVRRVGIVIRFRWWLVGVLALYSILAAAAYAHVMPVTDLVELMTVPAVALGFVVVYNIYFQRTYHRLGNLAAFNMLQLLLDACVVTVLVYYSGGVASWFWSVYSLVILESAFILPRRTDTWLLAAVCALLLGAVELFELLGILEHQVVPFAENELHGESIFVAIRYLWQVAVLCGTAAVGTLGVGALMASSGRATAVVDANTGLYTRPYLLRWFEAELRRARIDGRPLHLILLDLDEFGEFNRRFGFDAGDRLLVSVADALSDVLADGGDIRATTNVLARYGGEEFAVVLIEDAASGVAPSRDEAFSLAEKLRETVCKTRVDDACVTASVGLASFPDDGQTPEGLLAAADEALYAAAERGGDRVVSAAPIAPDDGA
jgi:diguanylate cyclase (GGDEF)-like protein